MISSAQKAQNLQNPIKNSCNQYPTGNFQKQAQGIYISHDPLDILSGQMITKIRQDNLPFFRHLADALQIELASCSPPIFPSGISGRICW
jgi:hypothetical protein